MNLFAALDRERVQLDPAPVGVVSVHVQLERVPRALGQAAGGAVVGRRAGPVHVLHFGSQTISRRRQHLIQMNYP